MQMVLLVEDDAAVRKVLRYMLRRLGYGVLEAAGVGEALALASTNSVDLLITDVVMPQDGCDRLVHELVQDRPELKVIYISGYAQDVLSRYGVAESDANFIQKPFTMETLARKIHQALDCDRVLSARAGERY